MLNLPYSLYFRFFFVIFLPTRSPISLCLYVRSQLLTSSRTCNATVNIFFYRLPGNVGRHRNGNTCQWGPSWEAIYILSQKIPRVSWNARVRYRFNNSPLVLPTLSWINPIYTHSIKINFNKIPHLTSSFPGAPFLHVPHHNSVYTALLLHTRCKPPPPHHSSCFHHPNNILCGQPNMKLLMIFIGSPLRSTPLPQHLTASPKDPIG